MRAWRGESSNPSTGRIALVTGASRGVGAATARTLAGRGADVIVNYRSKARRAEKVVDAAEDAALKSGATVFVGSTDWEIPEGKPAEGT